MEGDICCPPHPTPAHKYEGWHSERVGDFLEIKVYFEGQPASSDLPLLTVQVPQGHGKEMEFLLAAPPCKRACVQVHVPVCPQSPEEKLRVLLFSLYTSETGLLTEPTALLVASRHQ